MLRLQLAVSGGCQLWGTWRISLHSRLLRVARPRECNVQQFLRPSTSPHRESCPLTVDDPLPRHSPRPVSVAFALTRRQGQRTVVVLTPARGVARRVLAKLRCIWSRNVHPQGVIRTIVSKGHVSVASTGRENRKRIAAARDVHHRDDGGARGIGQPEGVVARVIRNTTRPLHKEGIECSSQSSWSSKPPLPHLRPNRPHTAFLAIFAVHLEDRSIVVRQCNPPHTRAFALSSLISSSES